LQITFEGAQERLKTAAERRKRCHDQYVKDVPLNEGQLVWLRDCGARGRHKIRDIWSSVRYIVVKAPKGGSVYTIAPANDLTKTKRVHRALLKAVVGTHSPEDVPVPLSIPPDSPQSDGELSFDGDLWVSRNEALNPPSTRSAVVTQETPWLLFPPSDEASIEAGPSVALAAMPELPSSRLAIPPDTCPDSSAVTLRRNARSTAGQHPNVHHLPRALGELVPVAENSPGPVSNSVSVIFRPWN